jgi:putative transposase
MTGVQGSALAVAVSNAGGLGSLPCAMLSLEAMRNEIVKRNDDARGFAVLPWRWGIERTPAWIDRFRWRCNGYERKLQTSESLIDAAMIRLMLRHLVR